MVNVDDIYITIIMKPNANVSNEVYVPPSPVQLDRSTLRAIRP